MDELEKMGNLLMDTALNFTHPMFEHTYPEWSIVSNVGEELVRMSKQPELNENQQVVLEWLKEEKKSRERYIDIDPFQSSLYWYFEGDEETNLFDDKERLSQLEFLQVLHTFAEWGMKNEQ